MTRWPLSIAFAAILAVAGSGADASTFTQEKVRCAVGGERFTATVQMSSTSFGKRPDGKAYSTGLAPPIECPGNGLVHYKDKFSPDEVAKLSSLIAGSDYQHLRTADNVYYRLYWLMRNMREKPEDVASALLVASWNSNNGSKQKSRYQREFITAVEALPPGTGDLFWLQLRAADLLREIGDHAQSAKLLAKLLPQANALRDPQDSTSVAEFISTLQTLNVEANRASEPTTLIPPEIAADICADPKRILSPSEVSRCGSAEIKSLIVMYAANRKRSD
jgi:hypothetical protein